MWYFAAGGEFAGPGTIVQVECLMQRQSADFADAVRQCRAIDLDGTHGPAQAQPKDS